jgi:predicted nucleotide-binding protein
MKILFQGGWKAGRDPENTRNMISDYCSKLASFIVSNNHTIVLTSCRDFDKIVGDAIVSVALESGRKSKDHLIYFLPERELTLPEHGRVVRIQQNQWWIEERTEAVLYSDALIAIGGGRGTFDCVEKAFLNNKPVFVAAAVPSRATTAWLSRANKHKYRYFSEKELETLDDINVSPEEFYQHVFSLINKISEAVYSRRIFIVHGHDLYARDSLVDVLRRLDFEPIVLADEPSKSLTIIEKLEKNTSAIGFSFIIYTPDDVGRSKAETDRPRARQNVIFEHGLLIGLIGRERTCALLIGEIEEPSDVRGMVYEQVNDVKSDALKIARVLKQAGYAVNASTLI